MYLSRWKAFIFSGIALLGILVSIPSFLPDRVKNAWPSWLPKRSVVLGLDLRGGVNLLLEVEVNGLLSDYYSQLASSIRKTLRLKKIRYHHLKQKPEGLSLILLNPEQKDQAMKEIADLGTDHSFNISFQDGGLLSISLDNADVQKMMRDAVSKSQEIMRRRIDEAGTLEPFIQSQGSNRIILQIPGFDDPARVRELLGKTAKLSLQWVVEPNTPGSITMPSNEKEGVTYAIDPDILLTGESINDARVQYGDKGEPIVAFSLTTAGGRLFSDLTRDHVGHYLAIVLDQSVLSAPEIKTHISGGKATITGMRSVDEAHQLALLIRSGALPAPLKILEEKVVGPGLGHDSIIAGTRATMIAVASVIVLMLLTYSWFGLFAVIGVCFNLIFLVAALAFLGATLTLPGIAGIALTVGIAVDANVLINERIKEELRLGKRLISAIDHGYRRAITSIIDSNVSTLIGAGILYLLGTGPVRGFAITMALGILISLFTSIQLTKFLVFSWIQRVRPSVLRI